MYNHRFEGMAEDFYMDNGENASMYSPPHEHRDYQIDFKANALNQFQPSPRGYFTAAYSTTKETLEMATHEDIIVIDDDDDSNQTLAPSAKRTELDQQTPGSYRGSPSTSRDDTPNLKTEDMFSQINCKEITISLVSRETLRQNPTTMAVIPTDELEQIGMTKTPENIDSSSDIQSPSMISANQNTSSPNVDQESSSQSSSTLNNGIESTVILQLSRSLDHLAPTSTTNNSPSPQKSLTEIIRELSSNHPLKILPYCDINTNFSMTEEPTVPTASTSQPNNSQFNNGPKKALFFTNISLSKSLEDYRLFQQKRMQEREALKEKFDKSRKTITDIFKKIECRNKLKHEISDKKISENTIDNELSEIKDQHFNNQENNKTGESKHIGFHNDLNEEESEDTNEIGENTICDTIAKKVGNHSGNDFEQVPDATIAHAHHSKETQKTNEQSNKLENFIEKIKNTTNNHKQTITCSEQKHRKKRNSSDAFGNRKNNTETVVKKIKSDNDIMESGSHSKQRKSKKYNREDKLGEYKTRYSDSTISNKKRKLESKSSSSTQKSESQETARFIISQSNESTKEREEKIPLDPINSSQGKQTTETHTKNKKDSSKNLQICNTIALSDPRLKPHLPNDGLIKSSGNAPSIKRKDFYLKKIDPSNYSRTPGLSSVKAPTNLESPKSEFEPSACTLNDEAASKVKGHCQSQTELYAKPEDNTKQQVLQSPPTTNYQPPSYIINDEARSKIRENGQVRPNPANHGDTSHTAPKTSHESVFTLNNKTSIQTHLARSAPLFVKPIDQLHLGQTSQPNIDHYYRRSSCSMPVYASSNEETYNVGRNIQARPEVGLMAFQHIAPWAGVPIPVYTPVYNATSSVRGNVQARQESTVLNPQDRFDSNMPYSNYDHYTQPRQVVPGYMMTSATQWKLPKPWSP